MKKIICLTMIISIILAGCGSESEDYTEDEIKENTTLETMKLDDAREEMDSLSEEDYKSKCNELFYDEVFFGEENMEGEYVKIHVFFSEKMFFDSDSNYNDTLSNMIDEYNLNRDFFNCCVLRKDTDSYVGQHIEVLFSDNYSLSPGDYEEGQKAIIYGKVIHNATNTWDGYNQMFVIPKYIDME